MLKHFFVILSLFLVVSCNYFSSGSRYTKSDIKVLDTVINYNSVDMYPLFDECNDMPDKYSQKKCFQGVLIEKLSESLKNYNYKVKEYVNDSSYVKLLINAEGKADVVSVTSTEHIKNNLPELDSLIVESVNDLPVLKPALKRGIPVKSQYKFAVVVRTID